MTSHSQETTKQIALGAVSGNGPTPGPIGEQLYRVSKSLLKHHRREVIKVAAALLVAAVSLGGWLYRTEQVAREVERQARVQEAQSKTLRAICRSLYIKDCE